MASALRLRHPLGSGRLAGGGRGEDVRVADAQLQVEEAGGGGDAAVLGVGLLHRVAVLQGVHTHPGLIWRETADFTAEWIKIFFFYNVEYYLNTGYAFYLWQNKNNIWHTLKHKNSYLK